MKLSLPGRSVQFDQPLQSVRILLHCSENLGFRYGVLRVVLVKRAEYHSFDCI